MKESENSTALQINSNHINQINQSTRLINSSSLEIINEKSQHNFLAKCFWGSFTSILCINLANIITVHSFNEQTMFIYYIYIASQILLLPYSLFTMKRPTKLNLFLLLTFSSTHLIITDPTIYSAYIPYAPSPISNMQMLLLLFLTFSQSLCRKLFLIISLSFSLISLALLIPSAVPLSRTLIEFFVLSTQILIIFTSKKSCKILSISRNETYITPLEEILDLLYKTITIINTIGDNCGFCREFLDSISDRLSSAVSILQTCKNIYSTQLEKLTKNMEDDEKVFIVQNAHNSDSIKSYDGDMPINRRSRSISAISTNKLSGLLKTIGKDWNFNTFFLKDCSDDSPLLISGIYVLSKYKLDSVFKLDDSKLETFLKVLESKYFPNPYHNSSHASDVMSSYLCFLNNTEIYMQCTDIELLVGILSTLAHDVGHPAKNNRFLIITKNPIAIQYNDISVLESMHCTVFFQILEGTELLWELSYDEWAVFRKLSIEIILATDMSKHFDIVEIFKTKYVATADFTKAEVRFDIFKVLIKAADIGHTAKGIELHKKWCEQVIEEFFLQGDQEKKLGLTISMYCDRDNTNIGKSQSGFIKNIVLPLYSSLNTILSSKFIDEMCIQQLKKNQEYWENLLDLSRLQTFIEKSDNQMAFRRRSSLPQKLPEN